MRTVVHPAAIFAFILSVGLLASVSVLAIASGDPATDAQLPAPKMQPAGTETTASPAAVPAATSTSSAIPTKSFDPGAPRVDIGGASLDARALALAAVTALTVLFVGGIVLLVRDMVHGLAVLRARDADANAAMPPAPLGWSSYSG